MTAPVYVFICTKTTYDVVVPQADRDMVRFMRRVHNGFSSISGGFLLAGDLKTRPTSDAIANHLLCDGSVLNKADFPQLAEYLGTTFGGDGATTFGLPNYHNDVLAVPPLAVTQTVTEGGTVTQTAPDGAPVTTVTQPTEPGQAGGTTGGNVVSGGRPRYIDEKIFGGDEP